MLPSEVDTNGIFNETFFTFEREPLVNIPMWLNVCTDPLERIYKFHLISLQRLERDERTQ